MSHPPIELYVDVTNVVAHRMMLPVLARGLSGDLRVLHIEPEHVTVNAQIR
jgi:hypothetical protein